MPQARRLSVAPDLTQQDLVAELERKDEIIRQYAENHSKLVDELSGAQAAMRATGKENARLEREVENQKRFVKQLQTKTSNRVVTDDKVEQVIDHWCDLRPRTRREESFPEDGRRRKLITNALKLMSKAEVGDVEAVCEAIDGLHIAPWEAFGRRYRSQAGKKERSLRNQLEDALRDETKIEQCRRIVRWARLHEARVVDEWRAACDTERMLYRAWGEAQERRLREAQDPDAGSFEVDGVVVRP